MAETKEQQLKREWLEVQEGLDPGEDPVDRMLSDMAVAESGWHRTRGRHSGAMGGSGSPEDAFGFAYFPSVPVHPVGSPEQHKLEADWESRSIAMHAAQVPIQLDAKSAENSLAARAERLRRGD